MEAAEEPISNIAWEDLNLRRFFIINPAVFLVLRTLQHPFNVIKTRFQMQRSHSLYTSTYSVLRTTLRTEGVPGLYRGFGTSALQLVVQQLYILSYEYLRSSRRYEESEFPAPSESVRNAAAAAVAVALAQIIANPIDVVAQRMMLQGQLVSNAPMPPRAASTSTSVAPVAEGTTATGASVLVGQLDNAKPRATMGVLEVLRTVHGERGLLGMWAGFWVSTAQFVPSAALWWSTYPYFKERLRAVVEGPLRVPSLSSSVVAFAQPNSVIAAPDWREIAPPRRIAEVLAGSASSLTVAIALNPLDIVRVRTQVEGKPAMFILRQLLAQEGVRGLWKGTAARVAMLVPHGAFSSSAYELVKRLSLARDE